MYISSMNTTTKNIFTIAIFLFIVYFAFLKDAIKPMMFPENKTITLVGLNYSSEDLEVVRETIQEFYGYKCVIGTPVTTSPNPIVLDCNVAQEDFGKDTHFSYDGGNITIYVSNANLVVDGQDVKGICYGNEIYVESKMKDIKVTVIHELAHSFGVEHCENQCIMNAYTFRSWNITTNTPNFCDQCKMKLPKKP